jgi:hypothetical protein
MMDFGPKALLEFVAELGQKFPGFSKPLLFGLPGLLIWFLLIPFLAGINIRDHAIFLLYKDQQYEQSELADQVDLINKLVDEHEYNSFDHQQELTDQIALRHKILSANRVQKLACGSNNIKYTLDRCYSLSLKANSNTHEIIRAFLQINKVYGQLLRSGKDDFSVHRFVDDLYISLSALTVNELECESVYRSYSTLRALHNRIDILPDEARDGLNIEVLRLLTFAAAFLANERSGGICSAPGDPNTYVNAQKIYTQRARDIKIRKYGTVNSSEFLRKLFWVDMSDLIISINDGDKKAADQIFARLSRQLPPEFLKSRLQQYRDVILKTSESSGKSTDLIGDYISNL